MFISQVVLKGFRNYKEATINFNKDSSLIIGSNDIGKSNLLYALRLLLDRNLSESKLEPVDSDFYAHENIDRLSVTIKFEAVHEDCIKSRLKEKVGSDGVLYLSYQAWRDTKAYELRAGWNLDSLESIESRFYLKVLNIRYIASGRDLLSFINKEKGKLLQHARLGRSDRELEEDNSLLEEIDTALESVTQRISRLNYVRKATDDINEQLNKLSHHHSQQSVNFDVGASDSAEFVDKLSLTSNVNGRSLLIGGDGRNNQIYLALWAARNGVHEENPLEVTFYCIEEPEAHLHPHQQRKLASYLTEVLKNQVIITSHSPQIACEFPPNSIIRLCNNGSGTSAANDGCGNVVEDALIEFGHRLSILPAETFFSNVVFLVEGVSEVIFYKALAKAIDIDLDRLNISILMADGVGFDQYVTLLIALDIPFVIRTDNDVFKVPHTSTRRFAGVERGIKLYKDFYEPTAEMESLLDSRRNLLRFDTEEPTPESLEYVEEIRRELTTLDIFLSDIDLENDLKNSPVGPTVASYLGLDVHQDIVPEMQKRKGTFMYSLIQSYSDSLAALKDSEIAEPLVRCREIAEGLNV